MKKKCLITGISGQDGAYLSKILLEKGYEVYGAERRSASSEHWRLKELGILDKIKMVPFELLEHSNIIKTLENIMPDEIYNLAAMSFVGTSFDQPIFTCDVNGLGVVRLLESIKMICPKAKFYQASTSEMFGSSYFIGENYGKRYHYQNEATPFHPRSPYGCAKLLAHSMVVNYREAYGIFACSGILFNHESPFRGDEFVTKKITKTLAKIQNGEDIVLELGNIHARRDWGHAEDYCLGMWLMLQQDKPDDFVLSSGETRSVKEFINVAAKYLNWNIRWDGEGLDEKAFLVKDDKEKLIVKINKDFYRPSDVEYLCGSSEKAKKYLNWVPKYSFEDLVSSMIDYDLICSV